MTLLRGAPFHMKKKPVLKTSSFKNIRNKMNARIKNSFSLHKLKKKNRNFFYKSYFSRFLLRKAKVLQKVLLNIAVLEGTKIKETQESDLFYSLDQV